jgi:hypothetical protein
MAQDRDASARKPMVGWYDPGQLIRTGCDVAGDLAIFPIGIERVPRKWRSAAGPAPSRFEPDDTQATPPALIEAPIEVPRSARSQAPR